MSARCPTVCLRDRDTNEIWCARLQKWVKECQKIKGGGRGMSMNKQKRENVLNSGEKIVNRLDAISTSIADVLPMLRGYAASMFGEMKNEIDVLEAKKFEGRLQILADMSQAAVNYAIKRGKIAPAAKPAKQ